MSPQRGRKTLGVRARQRSTREGVASERMRDAKPQAPVKRKKHQSPEAGDRKRFISALRHFLSPLPGLLFILLHSGGCACWGLRPLRGLRPPRSRACPYHLTPVSRALEVARLRLANCPTNSNLSGHSCYFCPSGKWVHYFNLQVRALRRGKKAHLWRGVLPGCGRSR